MKTKLMMMGALAATCAVNELAAMPTAEETRQAVPVVKKLLASEHEALKAGRKTRSEVAVAAMKRAGEAKTEAEKLLLMKGAIAFYVQDRKLEKAAETMKALQKAIPDIPAQSITNIVETALKGASKNVDGARLYKLLDEAKGESGELAGDGAHMATVDGYTWSYCVRNGEATIMAKKDGMPCCAVSPRPTGDLMIPATLGGVKVTRIGFEAFRNCDELTSVTIPEGVTHIDTHALAYCDGLKSVSLPSSLRDIGYAAFGKDMELRSVTIPNGVRSIAADAFNGCLKVKSLVIPAEIPIMGKCLLVIAKPIVFLSHAEARRTQRPCDDASHPLSPMRHVGSEASAWDAGRRFPSQFRPRCGIAACGTCRPRRAARMRGLRRAAQGRAAWPTSPAWACGIPPKGATARPCRRPATARRRSA